ARQSGGLPFCFSGAGVRRCALGPLREPGASIRRHMELNEILQIALRGGASDIHLKAGLPPMFRVDGSLVPLKDGRRLPPEEVARMAFGIMNEFQKEKFKASNEVDLRSEEHTSELQSQSNLV